MAKKGKKALRYSTSNNSRRYSGGGRAWSRGNGLAPPPRLNTATEKLISPLAYNEIVSYSRYLYLNNSTAKSGINSVSLFSINGAFEYKPLIVNEDVKNIYQRTIDGVIDKITINNHNLDTLLYDISTAIDVDGSCLINLTWSSVTRYPKVQLITIDRVTGYHDDVKSTIYGDKDRYNVNDGIITNKLGYEVAYIIDGQIVKSDSIIHCRDNNIYKPGKGLPLFAHAIKELTYIEQIQLSELFAMKIASAIALVETTDETPPPPSYNTDDDSYNAVSTSQNTPPTQINEYKAGQIVYLQPNSGQKIESLRLERPSPNYQAFEKRLVNNALSGAGIPNLFDADTSGSITRANLQLFDRLCKDRYTLLSDIVRQILDYCIAYMITYKDMPYDENWSNYMLTKPIRPSVDLSRDDKINIELYDRGLKTIDDFVPSGMTTEEFIDIRAKQDVLRAVALKKYQDEYGVQIDKTL